MPCFLRAITLFTASPREPALSSPFNLGLV